MSHTLASALYHRADTTPESSTLLPSAVLTDGDVDSLQLLEDGSNGKWEDGLAIGADLGSVKRVCEIRIHNHNIYYGNALVVILGWAYPDAPLTLQLYTSEDNLSWVLSEEFAPPDLPVKESISDLVLTLRPGSPLSCRFLKFVFASGCAYALASTGPYYVGYCNEIEVFGVEGTAENDLFLLEGGLPYIPASGAGELFLFHSWENTVSGSADLFLLEADGKELVQASASPELFLLESAGYAGAAGSTDLFLLESAGVLSPVIIATGSADLFLLESETSLLPPSGELFLLESDGEAVVLPDIHGIAELFLFTGRGYASPDRILFGEADLFLLEAKGLSADNSALGKSDLFLLVSASVPGGIGGNWPTDPTDDSGGVALDIDDDISLEYSNAF